MVFLCPLWPDLSRLGVKSGRDQWEETARPTRRRTADQHHGQESVKNQNKKLQTLPEQQQWLKYNKIWEYKAQPTPMGRKMTSVVCLWFVNAINHMKKEEATSITGMSFSLS
ncbi:hypothetical protein AVEN_132606-1 [Araneus ventricosus]|uniref:Uncharacterized protein n=1 Tax=Araneus ventricosus TaxID=182803 RepID=A0A4Y2AX72_ARAVE|nr:hypothetical protein AVEN_132606-1 [Araneus ventricosus]